MNKNKRVHKEFKSQRLERIELADKICTKVIPDKTKYTRKTKHKHK